MARRARSGFGRVTPRRGVATCYVAAVALLRTSGVRSLRGGGSAPTRGRFAIRGQIATAAGWPDERGICTDCGRIVDLKGMRPSRGRRCAPCGRRHEALLDAPLRGDAWRTRRAAAVAAARVCARCGADVTGPPIAGGRADVHHPEPRRHVVGALHRAGRSGTGAPTTPTLTRAGEAAALDAHDLEVLCKSCHGRETRAETGGRRHGGVGSDRQPDGAPERRPGEPGETIPNRSSSEILPLTEKLP